MLGIKRLVPMAYIIHLTLVNLLTGISSITFNELDTVGNITSLCPLTNLCSANASSTLTSGSPCCIQCSCERNCNLLGNCCPDAKTVYNPEVELKECYLPVHNYILNENYSLFIGIYGYHAYVRCPTWYTNERIRNKCERTPRFIDELTLVSDKFDLVFKNRYCAECNSVTEYQTWRIKILCLDRERDYTFNRKLGDISPEDSCCLWSVPRRSDISQSSRCFYNTIDSCEPWSDKTIQNGKELERLCSAYTLNYISHIPNVYGAPTIFKNVHCFMCNHPEKTPSEQCPTLIPIGRVFEEIHFTGLLNLALVQQMNTPIRPRCHKNCGEARVYDPYFDKCRSLICPWFSVPRNSECQPKYLTSYGKALAIIFMVTPFDNSSLQYMTSQQTSSDFFNSLRQSLIDVLKTGCYVCNARFGYYNRTAVIAQIIYYTTPRCSWNYLYQHMNDHSKQMSIHIRHSSKNSLLKYSCDMIFDIKNTVGLSNGAFRVHRDDKRCSDVIVYTRDLTCPKITLDVQEYDTFSANFKYGDRIEPIKEYVNKTSKDFYSIALSNLTNIPRVTTGYHLCAGEYIRTVASASSVGMNYCLITTYLLVTRVF